MGDGEDSEEKGRFAGRALLTLEADNASLFFPVGHRVHRPHFSRLWLQEQQSRGNGRKEGRVARGGLSRPRREGVKGRCRFRPRESRGCSKVQEGAQPRLVAG